MIVVVSGPGGVGKGTVVAHLVERDPTLWLSRSWTTRAPRANEAPDAYVFVTRDEFTAHRDAGGFLEWAEFLGELYGTPVPDPEQVPSGHHIVLEIDVQGARQISQTHPEALLVFIDAPSEAEQERRLRGRGDAAPQVAERLAAARHEREEAAALGMERLVNDDVEATAQALARLIHERAGD